MTRTAHLRGSLLAAVVAASVCAAPASAEMRRVAIANFGPHVTLDQSIDGLKQALAERGYVEGKTIVYEYSHGNFDPSLVPQILRGLEATNPDVMVTITTPITQAAVDLIQNRSLPIVCSVVTEPVNAGIVPSWDRGSDRFVCSSNLQSMDLVIDFTRTLLGDVRSMGMLYNPGDVADTTQLAYARAAAERAGLTFRAEGVESVNDIQQRTMALRGVDFIYVPSSSLLQPALPAAASAADRLNVPIINASHPGGSRTRGAGVDVDLLGPGGLQRRTSRRGNPGRRPARRPAEPPSRRRGPQHAHLRPPHGKDGSDAARGADRLRLRRRVGSWGGCSRSRPSGRPSFPAR